jgi:hypothetical protein
VYPEQEAHIFLQETAEALREHTRLILPSGGGLNRELDPMHRRLKLVIMGVREVRFFLAC